MKPLTAARFSSVIDAGCYSPYLSRLSSLYPDILQDTKKKGPDAVRDILFSGLNSSEYENRAALMQRLRVAKGKLALLTADADLSGEWTLDQVTAALSDFADRCLTLAVNLLLSESHARGEITLPHPERPSEGCGITVLGMGKLGGRELNYSSDIDLMIFFERGALDYRGRHNEQHFMNRLAHDLVQIMQERNEDGYVFRTDLRLRPDPASTPPAISIDAAHYYYESVGQNWERAAMIKARPVAGDLEAGERFLKGLVPFMWRRNLDFAAINDIHSIKRQMDAHREKHIRLAGHNVKLGLGGIREIEFFVQVHQLIWGGREPSLRTRGTCETLDTLQAKGLVKENEGLTMRRAYAYLRTLEHRLQMIADEQTHTLPESEEELQSIAGFLGYASLDDFSRDTLAHLNAVHGIYASSFRNAGELGGGEGNLVFTGVSHDPDTLATLRRMGYEHPETVSEIVMGWHHGSKRATRTQRAREILTELMPVLLSRLSETANPDAAFLKFNDFLTHLPAGVQLFSLFAANPQLLGLIADIMGSAPTLAEYLSKSPALLDAVLYADFYGPLPSPETLSQQMAEALAGARDFEERMERLTRFRNEKQFQTGVQLLKRMIDAGRAGHFLSDLADIIIDAVCGAVHGEFARHHGAIASGRFAVIALGKLGSREMTFGSDTDLVFVYDAPDEALSSGDKKLSAGVYYNRLAQRFIGALSAMGREGRLYEVDTRLRPSGGKGQLAASLSGLRHYFEELAWTFEFMAFAKARPMAGDARLREELGRFITMQLARPHDAEKLRKDALDMRGRIEKEFGTKDPWNIKYIRGGLIDIDFIAEYLLLRHASKTPGARPGSAWEILSWLREAGHLDEEAAQSLLSASRFLGQIFGMLRLCGNDAFDETSVLPGLKKLLCESAGEKDFSALKKRLLEVEATVFEHYILFFQPYRQEDI